MAAPRSRKPAAKATAPAAKRQGQRSGQPRGKPPGVASALLRSEGAGTVHDVLVSHLRLGADVAVAAARAKVTRSTVYDWLHEGGRIAAAIEAGKITRPDLSEADAAVLRFAQEAVDAVATAEAQALGNVVRLGSGGATRRRVTRKFDGAGPDAREVGRVEVEEVLPPDLAANVFLLERRFAERWARRQQLEISVGTDSPDAVPESPLPSLLAALDAMEERRREAERELAGGAASG